MDYHRLNTNGRIHCIAAHAPHDARLDVPRATTRFSGEASLPRYMQPLYAQSPPTLAQYNAAQAEAQRYHGESDCVELDDGDCQRR